MANAKYTPVKTKQFFTAKQAEKFVADLKDQDADFWTEYDIEEDANGLGVRQSYVDLPADDYADLYDKAWSYIEDSNDRFYGFEIEDWQQELRVARYTPGYYHDWHMDYSTDDRSKIALSVPLILPTKGGDFEVMEVGPVEQKVGQGILIPAFHAHRITPVEEGERWTLLGWATGPLFR